MRFVLVSTLAVALAACGQQPASNESDANSSGEASAAKGALSLSSEGIPQFRPGAWEITETSGEAREVRRECVGAETDAEVRDMLTRDFPKECKVERDSNSERLFLKASCTQDKLTIDTEVELTGSDTEYEVKMGAFVTTPDGKRNGSVNTSKARWVGQCPAGVKPGEEIEG